MDYIKKFLTFLKEHKWKWVGILASTLLFAFWLFPFSDLKDGANILIFPNLESSNIAYKLLQQTEYKFSLITLRKAAKEGRLPAKLIDSPVPYWVVSEEALMSWAANANIHKPGKPGRKTE